MTTATATSPAATDASPAKPLLTIRDLKTWFPIRHGLFSRTVGHVKAVDGVDLTIAEGQTVGLVGESGCGKTTLGRSLLGLVPEATGDVNFRGVNLLEASSSQWREYRRDLQMIFQDPFSSLNPRMTVEEIVTEGLVQHRLLAGESRADAGARLLHEVGLSGDALMRYPHEFSGGQRQRLCIARAISLNPEFIVCDEAVSALDVSVQAQVVNLLMELRERMNLSYLFISHDLSVVRHIAQVVAVMYLGRIVEIGPTQQIIQDPKHPYTKALISAVPVPGGKRHGRVVLQGEPPSPARPPSGCRFHTRCPYRFARCSVDEPELLTHDGRQSRCHLYDAAGDHGPGPQALTTET